jgi:hypothetical protein
VTGKAVKVMRIATGEEGTPADGKKRAANLSPQRRGGAESCRRPLK